METEFVHVKSKRKLKNANVINAADSNQSGLKIAKHAASSRSFQLPTNNKFSSLNEINLAGNNNDNNIKLSNNNKSKSSPNIPKPGSLLSRKMVTFSKCVI